MMSKSSLTPFNNLETNIKKSLDDVIKNAFQAFLEQPKDYKNTYRQSHFNCAFDGYSFLGQTDSLNQYSTDLLYSFVLSRFSSVDKFPKEFSKVLSTYWDTTIIKVKSIEETVIEQLNIPGLKAFYDNYIGHMVSCNYYPKLDLEDQSGVRLSKHVDVSLFTIFVYGASNGFTYEDEFGTLKPLHVSENCVVFPGYLLEYLTKGKYKALPHQVDLSQHNEERYSFAFFSIPKPNHKMSFNGLEFTSERYYQEYLELF
ncbi:2OG-Fe(II) oxygenase family protein [Pontimicrobium sp. IMCC45349]|uniref:2OG-Fe(II) oxygenase family protein n=1 Tax=Pontimicrobium sp. IMCC45349 TaxID=3391574 RepID=UPI0039A3A673